MTKPDKINKILDVLKTGKPFSALCSDAGITKNEFYYAYFMDDKKSERIIKKMLKFYNIDED